MEYDYFVKDHLGNVRMVLTEETRTDTYSYDSMEDTKISIEDDYYTVDASKIQSAGTISGLGSYINNTNGIGNNPADATFDGQNSQKLYRLNGNTNKTGLGITLKVMASDKINIWGNSFYKNLNTAGDEGSTPNMVLEILNGFLGGPTGGAATSVHGGTTATNLNGQPATTGGITDFVNGQPDNSSFPAKPTAGINYIFFDEQFRYKSSGFSRVGDGYTLKTDHHADLTDKEAPSNGYVYIYVNNQSPLDVWFDNLQVAHTRGQILEETHYYPFGLTMAGISSNAASSLENKKRFNGGTELQSKEFTDGSGLELYATQFRNLDPQIGKWWQIDSKPDYSQSLYNAMGNNPILHNDPLGDTVVPIFISQNKMPSVYQNHLNYIKKHPNEAINLFGFTMLIFNYEPDKKKQDENRRENRKANPVNNSDPSKQEDEVAPAATKEGGARGVRMAVPKEENAAHGGQIGAAIRWLKLKEGDQFLTILIPDNRQTSGPQTQAATAEAPSFLKVIEKVLDKFAPRLPFIPEGLPQPSNPILQ